MLYPGLSRVLTGTGETTARTPALQRSGHPAETSQQPRPWRFQVGNWSPRVRVQAEVAPWDSLPEKEGAWAAGTWGLHAEGCQGRGQAG